ncbi:4Fe-4S binding protein [Fusibacter sp. Q10-2]|uniref:4Fe-4S binding protein n=2 Tax=Fusibacter ferrireducens TaxID=2785058 RepID=A0ABR9ZP70_9FIRM|nr:4Fe-4S binding protein [Fusibacter ferrireducens]
MAICKKLSAHKKLVKPRAEIDWNPTIDYSKCNGCQICVHFCPKNVYAVTDQKPVVKSPTSCVLLCSRCMQKCPNKAIRFPDKADYVQYISYR